jgi:multiple sugar transport system permease protein/N,N'-diacetylchitobiose transport system permease protein
VRAPGAAGTAALLLLPSLIVVFGIVVYPLLRTLYTSFFKVDSPFPGHYPFAGLDNYRQTFGSADFWAAIRRTAYFTIVSTWFELIVGLLLALLLNVRFRGRAILRSIVILPWALPTIVNGMMWRWIYNPEYGALNALLTQLHIISSYRSWLGRPFLALNMVIVADVWKTTPLAAFLLLAGLSTIPRDLYEAARVDGAGAIRSFFSVTLPLLVPTILIVLVVRTIEAFKVFDIIYVMTRGGPANGTQTIAIYAYIQAFSNQLFGYGGALAYVIAMFILGFAIVYMRLLRREVEY